ncbi:MAG: ECF transporter S component [Dehalococcoidia bacterium]|jgi:energy-coupling factor transport system substrate-specific component
MARAEALSTRLDERASGRAGASLNVWSGVTLAVISAVGLVAFLYPLFLSGGARSSSMGQPHTSDAPLLFGMVLALTLLLFVLELGSQGMNAKAASALATLMMLAAVLRIPTLPAGATAFFFAVILGGYVFGARFGFLLGAGAMFVSTFAIGGFGPWLPFQVFCAGWVGMTAGWLGAFRGRLGRHRWLELGCLCAFGVGWGFLFGAAMNLWFWPFMASGESISWQPGLGLGETLRHYWSFYLLTSAGWDVWRAAANVVLIVAVGRPVLDVLSRFRDRFQIELG